MELRAKTLRNRDCRCLSRGAGCIGLIGMPVCAGLNEREAEYRAIKGKMSAPCAQNRTEQVAKDFDRNRDNAQFEAAASCWQRGDVEGSKTMLEHLLERNPNYRRARFVLADIYLFNGDSSRAIEELQKAGGFESRRCHGAPCLRRCWMHRGSADEAFSHYQERRSWSRRTKFMR